MTRLMESIINRLRKVSASEQDELARDVAELLDEIPTKEELNAIVEGWEAYDSGDYMTLSQLEHEMDGVDR
jgi:hypothetical protein